jgi:hypothetical protein
VFSLNKARLYCLLIEKNQWQWNRRHHARYEEHAPVPRLPCGACRVPDAGSIHLYRESVAGFDAAHLTQHLQQADTIDRPVVPVMAMINRLSTGIELAERRHDASTSGFQ